MIVVEGKNKASGKKKWKTKKDCLGKADGGQS